MKRTYRDVNPNPPKPSKKAPKLAEDPNLQSAYQKLEAQNDAFYMECEDLCDTKEKAQFMRRWIDTRFVPAKEIAVQTYKSFLQQLGSPEQQKQIESVTLLHLIEWVEAIWPKYLQAALNEMSAKYKSQPLELNPVEYQQLPDSTLMNLKDFKLFDDFLTNDIQLEACREFKMRSVLDLAATESEDTFLCNYAKRELLGVDESIIYNGLIQRLDPKELWTDTETGQYLELACRHWLTEFETTKRDFAEFKEKVSLQKKNTTPVKERTKRPIHAEIQLEDFELSYKQMKEEIIASATKDVPVNGSGRAKIKIQSIEEEMKLAPSDSSDSDSQYSSEAAYESSSEGEEEEVWVPRKKMAAYKEAHGAPVRVQ